MIKYLSFGGGVNSTALLLYLTQKGVDFETIFVNHSGDWPETYAYVSYLRDQGYKIHEIIPHEANCTTIIEYCYRYKMVPSVQRRFCTKYFKVLPIYKYAKKPCIMFIGISAEENKKRIHDSNKKGITNEFPLVTAGITRNGCVDIIKDAGLEVPQRSSCYFCPFIKRADARRLAEIHPQLFEQVLKLERDCCTPGYFISSKRIRFDKYAYASIKDIESYL